VEFEFKELGPRDLETLMSAASGVFDNPVNSVYAAEFLGDPRHHIVVSIAGGTVVGFVSAVHYIHPDKPPELWINEVAVAPPHRRRGIAKAMLKRMFEVGQLHRCTVAWVLTDRENPAAMALYESVGGREGADDEGPSDALLGYTFDLKNSMPVSARSG
jgi:ribosomal protein S18 acetylase RimI-like enzyme